ncbi:cell division protein ZapB [Aquisphaera insulae]|uniref:cell division protein ZapB n=1 Tax=Aquisphaera insulae TaxID=2712864 RepID=UPI0013EAC8DA|nr:cell division protein ZapB [Aquisphaera insulae]
MTSRAGRELRSQTPRDGRGTRGLATAVVLLLLHAPSVRCSAEDARTGGAAPAGPRTDGEKITVEQLARRLQRVEEQNARLAEQNARLTGENKALGEHVREISRQYDALNHRLEQPTPIFPAPVAASPAGILEGRSLMPPPAPPASMLPGWPRDAAAAGPKAEGWDPESFVPSAASAGGGPMGSARFLFGEYDDDRGQFVLVRPRDEKSVPFELRVDVFTQARYFDFGRSQRTWTDHQGVVLPVRSFQSLEITRNFIGFQGFALDPRLQYTAWIFSSTAFNDTVYLGWINYRFNRALDVRVGNWQVPGTREWYESFRYTMGAERLMATTFFRPNISPGIWIQGEPIEGLHYVAMLANSLNRFTQGIERVGSSANFGGTLRWEPLGAFGPGPSDAEHHERITPRLGTSVALAREQNQGFSALQLGNPEDTIIRLSDGTPLFRVGALGQGVELISTAVQLWTIDAALKYRGFAINGEYFFRWLDGFRSAGISSPIRSIFDHGGLLQAGYFVIPRRLEGYLRTSFVSGAFGGGYEVGGGINWYVLGTREWRMTAEILSINHSPAQNILTGYRAGESGTLGQVQWFTDF